MSDDEDRARKQDFLRREIIENNYDAEAFTVFCEEQRSADIDFWTYDELVECVKEFKHIQQFLPKAAARKDIRQSPRLVEASKSQLYTVPSLKAIDNELSLAKEAVVAVGE